MNPEPQEPLTGAPPAMEPPAVAVLPLQNGDRLTRAEFERRYDAMPGLKKAELIDGVVYMASPVSHSNHGRPHIHLAGWLTQYAALTPGVDIGDNSSLKLGAANEPQPDALLMIRPECGGRARLDADDYLVGAPELVAEVAASSASYDLHDKLDVYRRHGVQEYLVWRVLDGAIDWFALDGDRYVPLPPAPDGLLRSRTFPGLWLDAAALMAGDLRAVFQAVHRGAAEADHAHFVAALASGRT